MAVKGIPIPAAIGGNAFSCLEHAAQQYGRSGLRAALVEFASCSDSVVGQWFANDIRPVSRYTPSLYVALHLMGYQVNEFVVLDEPRRTILVALVIGGETINGLCDELGITEKGLWPLLANPKNQAHADKLTEIAESYREDLDNEVPLVRENLLLHLLLLRDTHETQPQPSTPTPSVPVSACDPRLATLAARLAGSLLVTLAMNPNREQLLAQTRHGKDLHELVHQLQQLVQVSASERQPRQ